jgi:hypothetical protein
VNSSISKILTKLGRKKEREKEVKQKRKIGLF